MTNRWRSFPGGTAPILLFAACALYLQIAILLRSKMATRLSFIWFQTVLRKKSKNGNHILTLVIITLFCSRILLAVHRIVGKNLVIEPPINYFKGGGNV
jgi:hypothetical protein